VAVSNRFALRWVSVFVSVSLACLSLSCCGCVAERLCVGA